MKHLCVAVGVLLACVSLSASGQVYSVTDGVPQWYQDEVPGWQQAGSFPVTGWAFHSGGAAIQKYSLRLDASGPKLIEVAQWTVGGPRPDVNALFAGTGAQVPDSEGWVAVVQTYIPLGPHTFTMCTTDSANGPGNWQCSAPSPVYQF